MPLLLELLAHQQLALQFFRQLLLLAFVLLLVLAVLCSLLLQGLLAVALSFLQLEPEVSCFPLCLFS